MATTIQEIELPKKARALDTSGNNNHGQIYSGRGLEFDGVADYLTTGFVAKTEGISTNITIACWVRVDDNTTAKWIWNFYESTSDGWGLQIGSTSGMFALKDDSTAADDQVYNDIPAENDTWYRVVVVLDDAEQKVYVNGSLEGSGTDILAATGLDDFTSTLYIGDRKGDGTDCWPGKMSDFQLWNTAWTAADVTYDYLNPEKLVLNNSDSSLTNSNLKLWYPMQDGHRGQQSYILDGANTGLSDNPSGFSNLNFDSGWSGTTASQTANTFTTSSSDGLYTSDSSINNIVGTTYKCTLDATTTASSGFEIRNAGDAVIYLTHASTSNYSDSFYFTATHDQFYIKHRSAGTMTVNSISVQPVNAKNHATTVFYGDEMVSEGDFSGADDGDPWTTGTGWTIGSGVASRGSHGSNSAISQTIAIVAGRTYEVKYDRTYASGDGETNLYSYFITDSSYTTLGRLVSAVVETVTVTDTFTPTYSGNMSLNIYGINDFTGTVDNVTIKEIGVASGWTDADQQLHIPQTALQSYNELAWFDGVADYVSISDHNDFTFGDGSTTDSAFSVSVWINMNDATKFRILSKSAADSTNIEWFFGTNASDFLSLYLYDNGAGDSISRHTTALTSRQNEWLHVVCTYDGGGSNTDINLYINGENANDSVDTNGTYYAMHNTSAALEIGRLAIVDSATTTSANGSINEVSLWGSELSQAEVIELYNDGKALDATTHSESSNLSGYWRNNGLSTWSNLDNPGTLDGTPTSVTETILIPAGVDATRDNQGFLMNRQKDTSTLNLDGKSYATVLSGPSFDEEANISISCWIKSYQPTTGNNYVVSLPESSSGSNGADIRMNSTTITFDLHTHSDDAGTNVQSTLTKGEWVHITATYDGTTARIYKNGVAGDTHAVTVGDGIKHASGDIEIGRFGTYGAEATGFIDGVLIYDDVLTQDEITRNYNAGKGSHRN